MDFLDKLVIPQSAHHMVLLKYLLVLTYILFIPYVSVLFGSLSLSLLFRKKALKTSEHKYIKFAKDIIDFVTFNKGVAFALGFVPLLSSAFCYAQLLHLSGGSSVPDYLLVALLFFIIALLLIYSYKYTFHLKDIFELASKQLKSQPSENRTDEYLDEEINTYSQNAFHVSNKSGIYGWLFLTIATYLFFASVEFAADTSKWGSVSNIFELIFSLNALMYYLQFLALSFSLTSALALYKFFHPNNEKVIHDKDYLTLIKKTFLPIGLISTVVLPATVVLTVITKSSVTYAFDFFGVTVLALILMLFISNLFYVMLKESEVKYSTSVIYLFIVVVALLVIKDQFAFDTSTKKQYAILAANFEVYQTKLNETVGGVAPPTVSGEEIYKNICSACHRFDTKLVGPPYKQTLPKYEGKMDQLVQFILNPVKKNPGYPAMPNQGLKPNEAQAVAKYIMETYKKK